MSAERGRAWVVCPTCGGHGQPEGDGHGWDGGGSYHTPACERCGGRGEVPATVVPRDLAEKIVGALRATQDSALLAELRVAIEDAHFHAQRGSDEAD